MQTWKCFLLNFTRPSDASKDEPHYQNLRGESRHTARGGSPKDVCFLLISNFRALIIELFQFSSAVFFIGFLERKTNNQPHKQRVR
jgi:hypothetical protein